MEIEFRYIRRLKRLFLQAGYPVISVDTKKKELTCTCGTRQVLATSKIAVELGAGNQTR